jgi:hypothetical protein
MTAAGVELAVGDRIVCLRNSDAVGVRNGTRATVEQIHRDAGAVSLRTDRGDAVRISARYLDAGHVRHAYALTGHAGQGATVERAFVLGRDEGQLQEWGYVALSRAREATRLYLVEAPVLGERTPEVPERDVVDRTAVALERPSRDQLASVGQTASTRKQRFHVPSVARLTDDQERVAALRRIDQERRTLVCVGDHLDVAERLEALDAQRVRLRRSGVGADRERDR